MTDLLDFLRARLDDTERVARWAQRQRKEDGDGWWWNEPDPESGAEHHIALHDPARVLREVEAKRRILDLHSVDHECSTIRRGTDCVGEPYEEINNCTWVVDEDCSTVRLLALPHSDHPEFRPEWRP